jgi:DNA-binding MarR family transcriptional regulator
MLDRQLQSLGISTLSEWDVLAFMFRHGTSLATAEHIARLLGYNKSVVGDALDRVASLGLVQRSRSSMGVRLYRFVGSQDTERQQRIEELMRLGETRSGRLLLAQDLRKTTSLRRAVGRDSLHLA